MRTRNLVMTMAVLGVVLLAPSTALAEVVLPSPDLPPVGGSAVGYLGLMHATYPQGVILSDPFHSRFVNIVRQDDGSGNEIETFGSTLTGFADAGSGPIPVTLTGPVTTVVFGKTGHTTGTFDTEIVSMSLTGDVGGMPVEIRESPYLPSPGQTTITDLGGGLWEIDSFFDVFTELSVDGGSFMAQTDGPSRMTLVPEPTTMVLILSGLAGLLRRGRSNHWGSRLGVG